MMMRLMATRTPRPKRTGRYTGQATSKEIERLIQMGPRGTHAELSRFLGFGHPAQLNARINGSTPWRVEQLGACFDFFEERGYTLPEGWPLAIYRPSRR